MYERSISNPVCPPQKTDRSFKTVNNDDSKPQRRSTFSLSNLGKRIVSSFSFSKGPLPLSHTSTEAPRSIYKRSVMSANADGFAPTRKPSIRIGEHLDSGNSKCISAATSFKDGSEGAGSPLFDPELLNVFERALEQLPVPSNNNEAGLAEVPSTDAGFRRTSSMERLHDGLELKGASTRKNKLSFGHAEGFLGSFREKKDMNVAKKILEGFRGTSRAKKDTSNLKKLVSSACFEFSQNKTNINELFERFPSLCPPGGDHKVVLFFTSLRGIRTTFENCQSVRMMLSGFRVKIDERDVSMHSEFKRELKDLLGKSFSLPRLFIKGRYIGGVEEAMQLNEDGLLRKFLEDVPRTSVGACVGCADVRFVPCSECCGSRKLISFENKVSRCPHCNENGLERCMICC